MKPPLFSKAPGFATLFPNCTTEFAPGTGRFSRRTIMEYSTPGRVILERFLNRMEAYSIYHFLDSRGLPVTITDRPLDTALGEIPFIEITTSLYLEDPSREEEARALIEHYRSGLPGIRGTAWTCAHCGESHEPMFGSCWNCGEARP